MMRFSHGSSLLPWGLLGGRVGSPPYYMNLCYFAKGVNTVKKICTKNLV